MKAPGFWKWLPALLVGGTVSLALAKLPAPPPVDPAKAAEVKQKAAEAAKKSAEAMARAQDRVVERYKKEKGMPMAATAKPATPVKPAAAAAPAKKK
ncbi:MAG: formate dehydrogenase [Betaproteobacteria bacterium]|nr:formate dehydrogenase [Betaproteobacteria bacterium]